MSYMEEKVTWGKKRESPKPWAREVCEFEEGGEKRRDHYPCFSKPSPQTTLISLTLLVSWVPASAIQMAFLSSVPHLFPPNLSLILPLLRIHFGIITEVNSACTAKNIRRGSVSRENSWDTGGSCSFETLRKFHRIFVIYCSIIVLQWSVIDCIVTLSYIQKY